MFIEEKIRYSTVSFHPWTDGKKVYYGSGWGLEKALLRENPNDDEVAIELPLTELIEKYTPVVGSSQYVVAILTDQTWCYWGCFGWTTSHKETVVFDTLDKAMEVFGAKQADFIEAVNDLTEFRNRPRTW